MYCIWTTKAKKISKVLGTSGGHVALTFLGLANFCYVSAFLSSWFAYSFGEIFICLFIGATFWYVLEILLIFGVSMYVNNIYALYIVLGIFVVIAVLLSFVYRKIFDKSEK